MMFQNVNIKNVISGDKRSHHPRDLTINLILKGKVILERNSQIVQEISN
jgi:predicted HTH domain antitoxin